MSTNLSHYTLLSALTLLTLGSLHPTLAASKSTIISVEPRSITTPFQPQDSLYLAQADNCRIISKEIGAVLYENPNKTGRTLSLPEGTMVVINPNNVNGNFIQITAVNKMPRAGYVNKMTLGLCTTVHPTPSSTTACYRVRNLAEIADQGGLIVRQRPSFNSAQALRRLEPGLVFRAANPPEEVVQEGRKWIKIAPIDGVGGYVNDGPLSDPVKNLEPASCAGVE